MFNPTITQALAQARVAELQRAATHSTATVLPRRHLRALALRYQDVEANRAHSQRAR